MLTIKSLSDLSDEVLAIGLILHHAGNCGNAVAECFKGNFRDIVLRLLDSEEDAGKNSLLHLVIEHEIELF
jgi:hypothetical protein